ncbi:MAG: LamB/YcsF family protein [Hyphomicrobiaceae bacterium]|nr:LamB/YcsF family protein [Hyphomicrobiaceae bacterium]
MAESPKRIDLNADMGESFSIYRLGNDEGLIPHVTTVNLACGYHAADPAVMRRSVRLARDHGVAIGAHISYPDPVGFGRRRMELSEDEVADITVHQIGALWAFCRAEGAKLTHVKAHGQLFLTGVWHEPTARGIARGMASVDPALKLLMYGPVVAEECRKLGVRMIHEAYLDLDYNPDCSLVLERRKQGRNAEEIAKLGVDVVRRQGRAANDGTWLSFPVESICVHGDGPNAPEIAAALRKALTDAGIAVTPLTAL